MKTITFILLLLLSTGCTYNINDYAASDPGLYYAGGDGLSFEQAVFFPGVKSGKQARPLKEKWLSENYPGYRKESQGVVIHDKKLYDRIKIMTAEGEEKEIYFDMTPYVGIKGRNKES